MDGIDVVTREPGESIPPAQFIVRTILIAVQLVIIIYLGQPGALFFYQMF